VAAAATELDKTWAETDGDRMGGRNLWAFGEGASWYSNSKSDFTME